MKSNEVSHPKRAAWAWLVALATVGAAGLGLWMTQGASLPLRTLGGLIVLMAVFSAVWLYRIRAAQRHLTALNAYAERELARVRSRRLKPPSRNKRALSQGPA